MLPWQQKEWQWFMHAKAQHRLPHALLLIGMQGIGKVIFAEQLARALLCEEAMLHPTEHRSASPTCSQCRLIHEGVHPNVRFIEPIKQVITVEQIREIVEFTHQSALYSGYRIIVFNAAHHLNLQAINALLKTLEEPSPNIIFLLIDHQATTLPATLLSRCQRLVFPKPNKQLALSWLNAQLSNHAISTELLLQVSYGAPLKAKALITEQLLATREKLFRIFYQLLCKEEDPLHAALALLDIPLMLCLDWMWSWMMDLLRLQCGGDDITNQDYLDALLVLKSNTCLTTNMRLMGEIQKIRGNISRGLNLNKQLTLESIFIRSYGLA